MKNITKALVVLLCLVLVAFSVISCGKDPADTTAPDTTAPDVTTPEETTPEETEPEVTVPEETDPEVTTPEETLPDETLPDETLPAETQPAETQPAETKPEETTAPAGPHKHEYQVSTTFPTCDVPGSKVYLCSCGDTYTEPGEPALGHAWVEDGEPNVSAAPCITPDTQKYKCVSCGATETRISALVPHDFTVSTQLVTPADDPKGQGYELLTCSICDKYLKKVVANHGSGHYLAKTETGYACACGATATLAGAIDIARAPIGKTAAEKTVISNMTAGGQAGVPIGVDAATAPFKSILGGNYNGKTVIEAVATTKIYWEGDHKACTNTKGASGNYLMWRFAEGTANAINIGLSVAGDLPELYYGSTRVALEKGVEYTLQYQFDLEAKKVYIHLTPEGGESVELGSQSVPTLDQSWRYYIDGGRIGDCADTTLYAMYLADITLDAVVLELDESTMNEHEACAHEFETERLVDLEHLAEDMWLRDTCSKCERVYDRQDCSLLGGHKWTEEPINHIPSTCLSFGYDTYLCLICGDTEERRLDKEHVVEDFEAVVSKANDALGEGFELWSCSACHEIFKVIGNHESGHTFDDAGKCACGAKLLPNITNVVFDDFSGEAKISVGNRTLLNGALAISQVNSQGVAIKAADNKAFADLYTTGLTADGAAIDELVLSFDVKYTGDASKITGGDFNWRAYYDPNDTNKYKDEFYVSFKPNGSQLVCNGTIPMEEGETYRLVVRVNPTTETLKVFFDDVLLTEVKATYYDKFTVFYLSRTQLYCANAEDFLLTADNMSVDYAIGTYVDTTEMAKAACLHDFKAEPFVSRDYPAKENWLKYTCECGASLYRQGECDTLGHAKADLTVAATCVENGLNHLRCVYCGLSETSVIDALGHDIPTEPTRIEDPACEVAGTKYYDCANGCGHAVTETIDALKHEWEQTKVLSQSDCTTAGQAEFYCDLCKKTVVQDLPLGCAYVNFGGVVSKAADPRGVGYELWSCPGCGETKKIAANHESGHFFGEDKACACGAKAVPNKVNVVFDDFSGASKIGVGNHSVVNGELAISKVNSQGMNFSTSGNPVFASLYQTGKTADGTPIEKLIFSFDIKYTGDFKKVPGGTFNWRGKNAAGANDDEFTVGINTDGDQLKINVSGKNFTPIVAGQSYRLAVEIDPVAKTLKVTLDDKVLREATAAKNYDTFFAFYLSRAQLYCENTEEFLLTADNMSVDYIVGTVADEKDMTDVVCSHEWVRTAGAELDTLECNLCDAFYTEEGCAVLGHVWSKEPVSTTVTCQGGAETYECLVCGEDRVDTLDKADHAYNRYVSTTAKDGATAGYETWMCQWCTETKTVTATHISGHSFDAEGKCACGAELKLNQTKNLVTDDFSTDTRTINLGTITLENGAWKLPQATVSLTAANNAAFAGLFDGENNGEEVSSITLSFDLWYTGEVADDFSGYRAINPVIDGKTDIGGSLNLKLENGAVVSNEVAPANKLTFVADKVYRVKIVFTLANADITSYVDGVVQKPKTNSGLNMANFQKIDFVGHKIPGAGYIDNMSIDYVYNTVDTTNQVTPVQ